MVRNIRLTKGAHSTLVEAGQYVSPIGGDLFDIELTLTNLGVVIVGARKGLSMRLKTEPMLPGEE